MVYSFALSKVVQNYLYRWGEYICIFRCQVSSGCCVSEIVIIYLLQLFRKIKRRLRGDAFLTHRTYLTIRVLVTGNWHMVVQTMNILVVHQSIADMCASLFTLLTAVVEVDGTRLSRDSVSDQMLCRFWLTRTPLWIFLFTSTYGISLMALERYIAIIHPIWHNNNVRIYSTWFECK